MNGDGDLGIGSLASAQAAPRPVGDDEAGRADGAGRDHGELATASTGAVAASGEPLTVPAAPAPAGAGDAGVRRAVLAGEAREVARREPAPSSLAC